MYQQCPRCEGKRVVTVGKSMMIILAILISSFFAFVGLFIPPFLFLSPIFLIGMIIASFFIKPKLFCQDCRYSWYPDKVNTSV